MNGRTVLSRLVWAACIAAAVGLVVYVLIYYLTFNPRESRPESKVAQIELWNACSDLRPQAQALLTEIDKHLDGFMTGAKAWSFVYYCTVFGAALLSAAAGVV